MSAKVNSNNDNNNHNNNRQKTRTNKWLAWHTHTNKRLSVSPNVSPLCIISQVTHSWSPQFILKGSWGDSTMQAHATKDRKRACNPIFTRPENKGLFARTLRHNTQESVCKVHVTLWYRNSSQKSGCQPLLIDMSYDIMILNPLHPIFLFPSSHFVSLPRLANSRQAMALWVTPWAFQRIRPWQTWRPKRDSHTSPTPGTPHCQCCQCFFFSRWLILQMPGNNKLDMQISSAISNLC